MSAQGWVTLILSIWGAGVSTILAVRTVLTDRIRLKLRSWPQCTQFKEGSPVWRTRISVTNLGRRPTQITHIGIFHRGGHSFWNEHPAAEDYDKLPCTLGEGHNVVFNAYPGMPPGEGGEMQVVKLGVRAGGREYFVDVSDEVEQVFN